MITTVPPGLLTRSTSRIRRLGVRDDADDVERHDVVEGVVRELQVQGVHLHDLEVPPAVPVDLLLRLLEHVGRQVDAGHLAMRRVGVEREAGADADLEHLRARLDVQRADHRARCAE